MIGEPKWFNTRDDVLNWQAECGEKGQPELFKTSFQRLYDGRMIWGNDQILAATDTGTEDEMHRIIKNVDIETGQQVRIQQELIVDANAYIFSRLNFTDGECRSLLGI